MKNFVLLLGLLTSFSIMADNQPTQQMNVADTPIEFNISGISFDQTYEPNTLKKLVNDISKNKNFTSFQVKTTTDLKTDKSQIYQIKMTLSQDWERSTLMEIKDASSNKDICFYQTSLIKDIIENKYHSQSHIIHNSKTKQNLFVGNINDDIEYKIFCSYDQNKTLDNPYFANVIYYNLKHTSDKKKSDKQKTKEIINKNANLF